MVDRELVKYLKGFVSEHKLKRFEETMNFRTRHFVCAIEDVYQERNSGALMRICDCYGIQDLYAVEELYPGRVAIGISKNADKWITNHIYDLENQDNRIKCVEDLKAKGYRIVATMPGANAVSPQEFSLEEPAAIFFGTELDGLSKEIVERADEAIQIPLFGFSQSLNVSVAAGVIFDRLMVRLHKRKDINWGLPEKDREEIEFDWLKAVIRGSDLIIERYYS